MFKVSDFSIIFDVLDFFFVLDLGGDISEFGVFDEKFLNSGFKFNNSLLADFVFNIDYFLLDLDRDLDNLSVVLGLGLLNLDFGFF